MKTHCSMGKTVSKDTTIHTAESLMSDHFTKLASFYSQYRTFDHEAINYITKKLASMSNIAAADIGCGDGRYSIKLIEKLRNRLSLTCVDNNYEMLQQISKISSNFENLQQSMHLPKSYHLMTIR